MAQRAVIDATVEILIAYLSQNQVSESVLKTLIHDVYGTIAELEGHPNEPGPRPAVSVEDSITDDHLICLEDGEPVVLLKRYLKNTHGMTPEEYIAKWNLPEDYPFVARSYSERRSKIAKDQGLGKTKSSSRNVIHSDGRGVTGSEVDP